ncbi:MAG: hypothetical protein ACRD0Z_15790 [Acidimicrobiales bacterium]
MSRIDESVPAGAEPRPSVAVGRMLFTMVDPNRGHEVAYNRWYERDHFYGGCMVGPHLFAGGRFVATRRLKDLRFPAQSPFANPVDAGSYLSVYWVESPYEDEHFAWARKQVFWLYKNGRGFSERTHAHTKLYDFEGSMKSRTDGVPIELALDHRYGGLVVIASEPSAGASHDDLRQAAAAKVPGLFGGGIDLMSDWHLHVEPAFTAPMELGAEGGTAGRLVQLGFVEAAPDQVWPAVRTYAEALAASGAGTVTFAAPFLATVVGTDKYSDELW